MSVIGPNPRRYARTEYTDRFGVEQKRQMCPVLDCGGICTLVPTRKCRGKNGKRPMQYYEGSRCGIHKINGEEHEGRKKGTNREYGWKMRGIDMDVAG